MDTTTTEATALRKFQYGKFGLKEDPRGRHVTLAHGGRDLLGEVVGVERDEVVGGLFLIVRHFDGTPWPLRVAPLAVWVIG